MEQQVLAPRVEDRDASGFGAQMLRIGGDGVQGLGAGPKQDVIDRTLVLEGNRSDLLRNRKHHVEIRNRQQFGLPVFQPLRAGQALAFWAVSITVAVVRDAFMAACVTPFDMASERSGATEFDRAHHAAL